MEEQHKRRAHYSGRYPRRFEEKYKEHNPEKYQGEIEKIIRKGNTPAGMHIPIMVNEILQVLRIQKGETGLDATLGYGGHTEKLLEQLQGSGHLYACDLDPIESEKTRKRLLEKGFGEDVLTVLHTNFADIDKAAPEQKFDFVLADLGVSSMQIDDPERGFTFKEDGPLDLRMDPTKGEPASALLKKMNAEEMAALFSANSDEPYAERIAKEIDHTRHKDGAVRTTMQLHAAISRALSFLPEGEERKEAVRKSSQRCFQALRMEVNSELSNLQTFLDKLPLVTAPGARIAILTFHSGEDRLVKKAFREGLREGVYAEIAKDVIRPSAEECFRNPRGGRIRQSCVMRSAASADSPGAPQVKAAGATARPQACCKKSFLQKPEFQKFARKRIQISRNSSCKSAGFRICKEGFLANPKNLRFCKK